MTSRYYTMTDSTGASGFLPTVTFTSSDNIFTSTERIDQLGSIGITGFYEADFADNITIIDVSAFAFDTSLVVATINGVTSIGNDAFYGCTALRSITLDTSVNTTTKKYLLTTIGNRALYGCTSLRNLHIPDTVKQIPEYLCFGCTGLEIAVMGYGCASRNASDNYILDAYIYKFAFANCSKLSFFIIPETVGYVGDSAFFNDPSLSYVAILGKPLFGTTVFGGTTLNTSSARYVYDITMSNSAILPSDASKNPYYEYEFTASSGNIITSTDVTNRFTAIGAIPQQIKVKLRGTNTGYVATIGNSAFKSTSITAANYKRIIGFSFPSSLTTIEFGAFDANSGGTNYCFMAAHYIPNSVTTTSPDTTNGNSYTFHMTNSAIMIASQTRQIVFQSGPNKIQLGQYTFKHNSARAIIINDVASTHSTDTLKGIPSNCFFSCYYLQFCNFFQKNAYSTFNRINANAFQGIIQSGSANSGTHYLYIPKQIQGTGFSNVFISTNTNVVFTVYDKYLDGTAGTGIDGLGTKTNGTDTYITTAGFGIASTYATFHIICNWYDANGLLNGTMKLVDYNYHVLFHPSIKTISNRFVGTNVANNTRLKSIAVHHSATPTVVINTAAFYFCTGLTNVYFNNRVKTMGVDAFRNAPLSNSFDLIDAAPLETIYHATFYTDIGGTPPYTSNLKQITIPKTVISLGSFVFGCSTVGLKSAFTTLSFENGIAFWGDYNGSVGSGVFTETSTSSERYMAIPAFFCEKCDKLTNVSFLNTAIDVNGNPVPNDGLALARPDNNLPIPTRYNTQTLSPAIKRIGNTAFAFNHGLQSIRIPEGVTTIDASGFIDVHSLSYLYLPDTLTSIGVDAFDNMGIANKFGYTGTQVSIRVPQSRIDDISGNKFSTNNISTYFVTVSFDNTSSKVASGVLGRFTTAAVNTYIKYHVITLSGITGIRGGSTANQRAFGNFTNLKTVTIANTVTDISSSAFLSCTGLTNVFFSPTSTLTTIGESAFQSSGLTTITIPSLVTDICSGAFFLCTSLTSVSGLSTGTSLVNIGSNAFNYCSSLTDISMNRVKSIGISAFFDVPLSNTFDLIGATSLEAIYYAAFYNDTVTSNLRQITIPSSVIALGYGVFSTTLGKKPSFTTLSFANGINFWGDYDGTLSNATTTASYDVGNNSSIRHMAIPAYFCENCNFLTSIANVLNKNPEYIGISAFLRCNKLTTITIPDSVTNIGLSAFSDCSGLTTASISTTSNLVTIGSSAFANCTSLTGVYLGNKLQTIGVNAFRNALLSNTFDLSSATTLQAIYHAAFYTDTGYTSNIRQITLPTSVKLLGSYVFGNTATEGKPLFTSISFQNPIEFWGDFDNNFAATTFTDTSTISNRYMAIPAYFCTNCARLTSVSFLDTVDAGGNAITADLNGALARPDNNLPITTRYNKQILSPYTIKRIGQEAFRNNKRLQSIRIPDGVTTIDKLAFYDLYSLSYVYIPDSLTTMGLGAFNYMGSTNEFGYTGKQVSVRLPQLFIDYVIPNTNDTNTGYFNPYESTTRYFTVAFDNTSSKVSSGVLGRFTNVTATGDNFYHVITLNGITGILGGTTRAFDNFTSLKTVTIADTVTDIGVGAFFNTGLTNVFISPTSNLTIINDSGFNACTSLTSFFIPNSVKGINASAFSGCTSLASVTYGNNPGLKYIGVQAFVDTTKTLTSIFIPSSVVYIGNHAFITNTSQNNILNTVTFGAGSRLRYIGGQCFGTFSTTTSATYLRDIVLPNTIRAIGTSDANASNTRAVFRNAFTKSHSANLVLPSSLEYLSESILYSDSGVNTLDISNIYLPLSITTVPGPRRHCGYTSNGIGEYTFFPSSSKTGSLIYLPSHLSGFTTAHFSDASRNRSYYKTVSFTSNPLTSLGFANPIPSNVTSASNTTQIHADIKEGVTVIGSGASIASASNNGNPLNLISLNIPSTVTDICANAFSGCSALAYVTFSENSRLTTIDAFAFSGCSLIPDIQLPDTLTTIGESAFSGCNNLASISIPYNVTSIGPNAFAGTFVRTRYVRLHEKLYNDISGSLSTYFPGVSASSFQVIPALQLTNTLNPSSLTISQINNMYIRYRQSQLGFCTFITVSDTGDGNVGDTHINAALSGSTGLVHLDFGPNVTFITPMAGTSNTRIYSVAIPKKVTYIGTNAFSSCTNLTYLSFHPDSVCTSIGVLAFHNTNIMDLALPDSLTTIGVNAFRSSPNLALVCIPKNVTSLGTDAFYNCSKLTSVALPSQLSTAATSSYFNTNGSTAVPGTFTIYDTAAAIPHFKLSEYSLPSGIVQTVVDSAVTYIDHRAYAYYPDITLYAVTTNKQTQTAGQYNYVMNGIKMPFQPAAFLLNGSGFGPVNTTNSMFPLYRSIPDLNVFSLSDVSANWIQNVDDFYILMPGYSICIYNNLYDEENLFNNITPTERYYDNEFGKVPLNIDVAGRNTTTSILIMYKGRILSKYFST